ncbi:MAG: helix-turn-helix domain-containing protein [Lachnospiraceae bacterium]|nr:helix-turn-helix domain-containing protein [Lachnospiraceae bacterium]
MAQSKNGQIPVSSIRIARIRGNAAEHVPDYLFLWALRGEFGLILDQLHYTIRSNDVLLLLPGQLYNLYANGQNEIMMVQIRRDFFEERGSGSLGHYVCSSAADQERDYEPLRRMLAQLALTWISEDPEKDLLLNSQAYSLLYYMNRYHYILDVSALSGEDGKELSARARDIVSFVEDNYRDHIGLSDLAAHLNLSAQYASRLVKRCLGRNYISYLNQVRLQHACDDLVYTDKTVLAVATDNGFSNMNSFNRLFRDTYKITPSQYRAENRKAAEPAVVGSGGEQELNLEETLRDHLGCYGEQNGPALSQKDFAPKTMVTVPHAAQGRDCCFPWQQTINIGYSDYSDRAELKEHMQIVQKEIGFSYGRLQAVLNESMLPTIPGTEDYNYSRLDQMIENMLAIGMRPFLDLTYKFSHVVGYSQDQGNERQEYMIEENRRFSGKVSALIRHCINAFGRQEVENWQFEIGYLHDENLQILESPDYFCRRFQEAYYLIKEMLPGACVGGMGYNIMLSDDLLEEVLNRLDEKKFTPDFLSVVFFAYCSPLLPGDPENSAISSDPDRALNRVRSVRKVLDRHPYAPGKLYLTAFGQDISARNYVNDSCYQAAFLVKNAIDLMNQVDLLAFWQLSDICDTHTDSSTLLFGGNGLLSQAGLKKPGFSALKRMKNLGEKLVQKGPDYLVTTDNRSRITLVMYHYSHFNDQYCVRRYSQVSAQQVYSVFDAPEVIDLTIRLEGLTEGRYRVNTTVINREHGSILDQWLEYGQLEHLYPRDIQYFRDVVHPHQQVAYRNCEDGILEIHAQLSPHEIRFVELTGEL